MKYDYVKLNPSEQIGTHSQPSWELSYILRGRGTKSVGDTESPFREGDMVLVVPEMRHCWRFEDEDGGRDREHHADDQPEVPLAGGGPAGTLTYTIKKSHKFAIY